MSMGTKRPKGDLEPETRYKVVRTSLGCGIFEGTVLWDTVNHYHMCFVGLFRVGCFVFIIWDSIQIFFWNPYCRKWMCVPGKHV